VLPQDSHKYCNLTRFGVVIANLEYSSDVEENDAAESFLSVLLVQSPATEAPALPNGEQQPTPQSSPPVDAAAPNTSPKNEHTFTLVSVPFSVSYRTYRDANGNRTSAAGGGFDMLVAAPVGMEPVLLGVNVGFDFALGGERFGYDLHTGLGLGLVSSWAGFVVIGGGGSDAVNFGGLGPAWYAEVGADLSLRWFQWLRTEGALRQVWRTKDTTEQRLRVGLAFACLGGTDAQPEPCLQFSLSGLATKYPEIGASGLGVLAGVTVGGHIM
jgi:hypothetical protein